jgi:hypothetical protein
MPALYNDLPETLRIAAIHEALIVACGASCLQFNSLFRSASMLEPSLVDLPFQALESVTSHFYTAVESSGRTVSGEVTSASQTWRERLDCMI